MGGLLTFLGMVAVAFTFVLGGCAPVPDVPMSDDETAEALEMEEATREAEAAKLQYVLAPGYLPESAASGEAVEIVQLALEKVNKTMFTSMTYTGDAAAHPFQLLLAYPEIYGKSNALSEGLGLVYPDGAVTETTINGETAYVFHGRWTEETLARAAVLDMSEETEWAFDNGHLSVRFRVAVPFGERVWASLATVLPSDRFTEQDLIRIAESVAVVD